MRNGRDRVLVLGIEDDKELRRTLADVLQEAGYETQVAWNGADALGKLRRGPRPRVILLDLMMPVMNGWQFRTAQLEDPRLADIPVIVLTAADIEEEAAIHPAAYLRKSIRLDGLLQSLARCCQMR
jgi:CheY-like chemotaxis protein